MRALLDTHTFRWWIIDNPQISSRARDIMSNSSNELFLSAASCWEIAIKAKIGRIKLPVEIANVYPVDETIPDHSKVIEDDLNFKKICVKDLSLEMPRKIYIQT